MGKKKKSFAKSKKLQLKNDNLKEDKIIKSLEKKLKLKKKSSKSIPKSFVSDGLDYILDLCNEETRKIAAESEKQLMLNSEDESNGSDLENDKLQTILPSKIKDKSDKKDSIGDKNKKPVVSIKKKKLPMDDFSENEADYDSFRDEKASDLDVSENDSNSIDMENYKLQKSHTSQKQSKNKTDKKNATSHKNKKLPIPNKKKKMTVNNISDTEKDSDSFGDEEISDFENEDDCDSGKESHDKEDNGIWEDIYGRKRNKDGTIVTENKQKYIAPAMRFKQSSEKNEKLLQLRRQIKGLLNRLAESNMHAITSQLDELYMSNSRNDMNEMISNLMLESIVAPVLTPERLVTEHMMCIAILHANVGTEVGAHFIMILVKKFTEMIQQSQDVENKEFDNIVLMMCHLYNFKVFGSQIIYQILNKLIDKFTEKEIEIILLILKTAGFRLRKDDPLALKELILNLQQKATTIKSSNTRVQFMLDILMAIKNNNMSKIPQYDQSYVEHLKKILKTIIRKGNSVSQLNLSLEDLLNADENGKWWIVGSAWSGKAIENNKPTKAVDDKPVYSKKILELARAQRMNTDIRKNIFCVLMTSEDYLDAFEKLHHLGLKDRQEREIIYVILNCCMQEKNFNPYYTALLQKFCEYDRKYQMSIQYTLWDKLKILNNYNNNQLMNMAKMMSYLFIQKALPLSVLKVVQLGELDAPTMKLFKKIMLDILLYENTEMCLQVFERIAAFEKLHQFRESLRLFINYFLLKNMKKEKLPPKQMLLLEKRIALVDKILMNSTSKLVF